MFLTLLGPQSRFGDNGGLITWNLTGLSPKRDWSLKGLTSFRICALVFGDSYGGEKMQLIKKTVGEGGYTSDRRSVPTK